jgi:asparagine N-glycosylation enzyme membrane subunit Stt3
MAGISTGAAVLWWIGIAALFLVVIPLVLVLVQGVLRHLAEIKNYAADVREHGVAVSENLAPVSALAQTRDLVKSVAARLGQYANAVGRVRYGAKQR